MKISYEVTFDEAVDLNMLLLKRSNTVTKWKWQGLVGAPIVFVLVYLISPFTVDAKLVGGTVAGGLFIAWHLSTFTARARRRVRRLLIEQLGSEEPFPCEHELQGDGLVIQTRGTETKFQWSSFIEINETGRDLELITGDSGIVVLPKRVFQSEKQKDEWLSFVKEKTRISEQFTLPDC